ncbi:MAG: hypothetical protein AAGA08_07945 [Pseudomonadota bacterium]
MYGSFKTIAATMLLTVGAAQAVPVDVFLIADQTTPSSNENGSLEFTTNSVFQLGLDADTRMADSQEVVDNFNVTLGPALTYNSHTGNFNQASNEGADTEAREAMARANSEIGTWDDVGIVDEGTDAARNIDYGSSARIEYNEIDGGFFDLIIAEDGGLDPFKLSLCDGDDCSEGSLTTVFDGFTASMRDFFLGLDTFAALDSDVESEMDQAFLFRFDENVTDHLRIDYSGEFSIGSGRGTTKLEIDFAGAALITPVPLPAGMLLLLSGLGLFGTIHLRKSRSR